MRHPRRGNCKAFGNQWADLTKIWSGTCKFVFPVSWISLPCQLVLPEALHVPRSHTYLRGFKSLRKTSFILNYFVSVAIKLLRSVETPYTINKTGDDSKFLPVFNHALTMVLDELPCIQRTNLNKFSRMVYGGRCEQAFLIVSYDTILSTYAPLWSTTGFSIQP